MKIEAVMEALRLIDLQNKADGCENCVFYDKEEWEMPCAKCMRNCKDYWRYGGMKE